MCPGDQLNLTCHAIPDETILQWSLAIPGRSVPELRFIPSSGNTASVAPLFVNWTNDVSILENFYLTPGISDDH